MSKRSITIAIDAMGGDKAPQAIIRGINIFLKKNRNIKFLVYGDKDKLNSLIRPNSRINKFCTIVHTSSQIGDEWKVFEACKNGKGTSMWEAINAVKNGEADAVISAGNTGALMAISKMLLKTLPGIDRPAIINCLPTKKLEPVVMLDLGANSDCTPEILHQFAIMGGAYAKVVNNKLKPKISLLNIGSEQIKGNVTVQETANLLKENKRINYTGFVEGDKILDGNSDVIVTDGFTGNIALKVLEGTAKYTMWHFSRMIKKSTMAKVGLTFLLPSLLRLKNVVDPRRYNGAMLIGLNGVSVKSHGSSDKISFSSAIMATSKLISGKVNQKIVEELKLTKD